MRKLQLNFRILSSVFFFSTCGIIFAQEGKTTVQVDPKVEELLSIKKKMNTSIAIEEGYKIQIFNGSSADSEKARQKFKSEFKEFDSTIKYSSPTYKVFVGPFESRILAEGAMQKIREKYPNALMIKP